MILGVLSDTHGNAAAMSAGMELLRSRGAGYFLHCGDVGSEEILDYLAGLPSAFVWGNCDFDRMGLQRYAQAIGITCFSAFGDLTLADKRIALLHGDDENLKRQLLMSQQFDYVFCGHTHRPLDEWHNKTRLVNPGALHRANPRTVGVVDLAKGIVEIVPVGMEGSSRSTAV